MVCYNVLCITIIYIHTPKLPVVNKIKLENLPNKNFQIIITHLTEEDKYVAKAY